MHRLLRTVRLAAPALLVAAVALPARGQLTNAPAPDPLSQLMVSQPSIEVVTNPVALASFDPPVVRPGELSTYRVTFNALDDSIQWPDRIVALPALELRQSARGQLLVLAGNRFVPQTTINLHAHATNVGPYVIAPFTVEVYGRSVTVPAARLEVVPPSVSTPPPGPRLTVEVPTTNIFVGQSVTIRLLLPASVNNAPQRLVQARLNGEGLLVDHTQARQIVTALPRDGRNMVTSAFEMPLTPLAAGKVRFTAQGFASGGFVSGPVLIPSQPMTLGTVGPEVLLDSDPVTLNVRPLPRTSALPGFTGAVGTFTCDPPQLSATQALVGDLVKLTVTIRGEGNLARLVPPPPPVTPDWQVMSPVAVGTAPPVAPVVRNPGWREVIVPGQAVTFSYSLTPLAVGIAATPPIPFSYFDPERAAYVDLTIPPVPIAVMSGALTNAARLWVEAGITAADTHHPLVLGALAPSPGRRSGSFVPLQLRGWFVLVQLLPVIGFAGLWSWDRRRRYLEQHPDVVRRRQARRALRKERRALQKALEAADAQQYAEVAVRAMRVACAPHFPAEPRALVCRDVLEVIGESETNGDVVRSFFAVADASRFSISTAEARDLMSLQPGLEQVLGELEARL